MNFNSIETNTKALRYVQKTNYFLNFPWSGLRINLFLDTTAGIIEFSTPATNLNVNEITTNYYTATSEVRFIFFGAFTTLPAEVWKNTGVVTYTCHADCLGTNCAIMQDAARCTACAAANKFLSTTPVGSCASCDASCLTCNGASTTNCLTCAAARYLSGVNSCLLCNAACTICTGGLYTQCSACAVGYNNLAVANECRANCAGGTWQASNNFCCHISCASCTGAASN
jgi:hypothetical protein